MRHDIYKKAAAWAVSGLLLLPSLLSCSDEQGGGPELPEEPQLCKVIISLQSPTGMRPATRAEGDDENPGSGWEEEVEQYERRMEEWVVVAYDEDGEFAGLVSNKAGHTGIMNDDTDKDYNISIKNQLELPFGKYTFFAFANWSSLDAIGTLGDDGKTITDIKANLIDRLQTLSLKDVEGLAAQVGDIDTKYNAATGKKYIPMSSYGHLENLQSDEYRVRIPLIRMIGKVQVTFDNQLEDNVTITAVKVGNFQERPVFWVPWGKNHYLEFDDSWIDKDDWANAEHWGPAFPDKIPTVSADKEYRFALDKTGFTVEAGQNTEANPLSCYVNESVVSSATPTSNMLVTITRQMTDGSAAKPIESRTDFAFVRRNDLLKIPVLLSNFATTLGFGEVRLPIGVYPTKYKFGYENGVQVLAPITYSVKSTGQVKVTYTLEDIIADGNWSIRYPETGGTTGGVKYSRIEVIGNSDDLLINPDTHKALAANETIAFGNPTVTESTSGGSFTLCTQELGQTGIAQILLTLIVEYGGEGNKRDIEIPYTINITNAPEGTTTPEQGA